jgi:hypothetical protein
MLVNGPTRKLALVVRNQGVRAGDCTSTTIVEFEGTGELHCLLADDVSDSKGRWRDREGAEEEEGCWTSPGHEGAAAWK